MHLFSLGKGVAVASLFFLVSLPHSLGDATHAVQAEITKTAHAVTALLASENELAAAGSTLPAGTFATTTLSQVFTAPYIGATAGKISLSGTATNTASVIVAVVPASYAGNTSLASVTTFVNTKNSNGLLSGATAVSKSAWSVTFASTIAGSFKTYLYNNGTGSALLATASFVVINPAVASAPSCNIAAEPSKIAFGDSTTLIWSSKNASSAYWQQDDIATYLNLPADSLAVNGSAQISTTDVWESLSLTPTLVVDSPTGAEATCSTTITIVPPPTCTMYVNGSNEKTTTNNPTMVISWSSQNADRAIGFDDHAVDPNGRMVFTATSSSIWGITFSGKGGSTVCGVHIEPTGFNVTPVQADPRD